MVALCGRRARPVGCRRGGSSTRRGSVYRRIARPATGRVRSGVLDAHSKKQEWAKASRRRLSESDSALVRTRAMGTSITTGLGNKPILNNRGWVKTARPKAITLRRPDRWPGAAGNSSRTSPSICRRTPSSRDRGMAEHRVSPPVQGGHVALVEIMGRNPGPRPYMCLVSRSTRRRPRTVSTSGWRCRAARMAP